MNKEYWTKFYQDFDISFPTSFATWILPFLPKELSIMDVGCGNGRDSYHFGANDRKVIGIDYSVKPQSVKNCDFHQISLCELVNSEITADIIYSRFFIHSISLPEIKQFLKWTNGLFVAEFRILPDEPKIYPEHKRTLLSSSDFICLLLRYNYEIIHISTGHGMAKFKEEDPFVMRVIAKHVSIR